MGKFCEDLQVQMGHGLKLQVKLAITRDMILSSAKVHKVARARCILHLQQQYKHALGRCIGLEIWTTLWQVDPSDIVMLVVSWHLGAATMCEYTKSEFMTGMQSLGCDSIEKLRRKLPALRAELQNDANFKVAWHINTVLALE